MSRQTTFALSRPFAKPNTAGRNSRRIAAFFYRLQQNPIFSKRLHCENGKCPNSSLNGINPAQNVLKEFNFSIEVY